MTTVIIDVRTKKEFQESAYPAAINKPSNEFNLKQYLPYKNNHIALVCFSGNRASKVKRLLEDEGFSHVTLLQQQMVNITEKTSSDSEIWSVDRQFRFALGCLIGFFLIGNYMLNSAASLVILLIVFSGLIYSAISDNCYLKMFIASLPWNRKKRSKTAETAETVKQFGV